MTLNIALSSLRRLFARPVLSAGILACSSLLALQSAQADKIKHPIAVFSGLDKITGRIISFEVAKDETVQFGTLQITERVCYTRPATEAPQTTTFVEVDDVDAKNNYKRIFTGWMFASSPGLHGIEHPVYDVWLTGCKGEGQLIPDAAAGAASSAPPADNAKPAAPAKPSKPRLVQPHLPQPQPAPPPSDNFDEEPPPPQDNGPVEVGPPPGFNAPKGRPHAADPSYPVPPGDVPDGGQGPGQGSGQGNAPPSNGPGDGGF